MENVILNELILKFEEEEKDKQIIPEEILEQFFPKTLSQYVVFKFKTYILWL